MRTTRGERRDRNRRANMSIPSSSSGIIVLAGYYPPKDVVHFHCYAAETASSSSSSLANRNHGVTAADCCTLIFHAQSRMQEINEDQVAFDGEDQDYPRRFGGGRILADFSLVECEQNLLHLRRGPPLMDKSWFLSRNFPQKSLPLPFSLVGMLTHTPNKTAARNLESEPDPCSSMVQLWCSWRWFLWNGSTDTDDSGHWIAQGKETKPMNAAWVPTTETTDAKSQIRNGNNASSFIHLFSSLSKSGGMHRELRQKLSFSLPTDFLASGEASTVTALRSQYDYSIDIILSIPPGLFINVEDASFTTVPGMKIAVSSIGNSSRGSGARTVSNEDGGNSKAGTENLSSTVDTALIIDQEEPAFVSPGHLVLCRLTGPLAYAPVILVDSPAVHDESNVADQGTDSLPATTTTIELTWDTHLHVRYPMPIQNNNNNDKISHHHYYSQITFMPPMIVAGKIFDRETKSHSYTLTSAAASADAAAAHDDGTVAVPFWMLPRQAPLTLWVAAGHHDDFQPIFVLTLLAALIGTVVLLRDMMFLYTPRDDSSISSSSRTKMASQSSSPLSDRQIKTKKDE
jgi:hypothetical protein